MTPNANNVWPQCVTLCVGTSSKEQPRQLEVGRVAVLRMASGWPESSPWKLVYDIEVAMPLRVTQSLQQSSLLQ